MNDINMMNIEADLLLEVKSLFLLILDSRIIISRISNYVSFEYNFIHILNKTNTKSN